MGRRNTRIHQPSEPTKSSPRSPDQLAALLDVTKCGDQIFPLQDAVGLAEHLDNVLDTPTLDSSTRWKLLRILVQICYAREILLESCTLSDAHLIIGSRPVASGAVADTYEGSLDGRKVCIKRFRVYSDGDPQGAHEFCREAVIWGHRGHPNIVPFLGATISPLQLISDWMPGGNVMEYLKKNPGADRLSLLLDTSEGLNYLHSHHVVHGDLKGLSILVDDTGRARLTDFGLATVISDLEAAAPIREHFSVRWAPPELLCGQVGISKETDIYSFGMVAIEVFSGTAPFFNSTPASVTARVLSGERPERPEDPTLTDGLWNLIRRCLEQDPQLRPEIVEMVCGLQGALIFQGEITGIVGADGVNLGSTRQRGLLHRTRCLMLTYKPWGCCKLNKPLPESRAASEKVGIKTKESEHSFHRIGLGPWLLNIGAPSVQGHDDYPDSPSEKQGSFLKLDGMPPASNRADCSVPPKPPLVQRTASLFLSCMSSKDMV